MTPRQRILEGAITAALQHSLRTMSVDDIAKAAGLSRATVYRHFTGGREEIIQAAVEHEFEGFLASLASAMADAESLEGSLVDGLMHARHQVDEHELLQRELSIEPEVILPYLTVADELVMVRIEEFLNKRLRDFDWPPDDVDDAAEHMARLVLSFIGASGSWDLSNRVEVVELVRSHFLGRGVTQPTGQA